jgi:hypothetical protein
MATLGILLKICRFVATMELNQSIDMLSNGIKCAQKFRELKWPKLSAFQEGFAGLHVLWLFKNEREYLWCCLGSQVE